MLLGYSIIDGETCKSEGGTFAALDPTTGATLEPTYHYASLDDVDHAADLADEAYVTYSKLPGKEKAKFLRHIATGLEGIGAELVDRAHKETGLPEARLKGELARTTGQLRLFAQVVEE
jgi:alpha-ketoglutaric semialdehyde dehydrogenase